VAWNERAEGPGPAERAAAGAARRRVQGSAHTCGAESTVRHTLLHVNSVFTNTISCTIGVVRRSAPRGPPRIQNPSYVPLLFIGQRLSSYEAREPSIAKSTYKTYLLFGSFWRSSSLRVSALLSKPRAERSRITGPLCWHTPSRGKASRPPLTRNGILDDRGTAEHSADRATRQQARSEAQRSPDRQGCHCV
jgi:hypothetical protein